MRHKIQTSLFDFVRQSKCTQHSSNVAIRQDESVGDEKQENDPIACIDVDADPSSDHNNILPNNTAETLTVTRRKQLKCVFELHGREPQSSANNTLQSILGHNTHNVNPLSHHYYNQNSFQVDQANAITIFGHSPSHHGKAGLNTAMHILYGQCSGDFLPRSSEQYYIRKKLSKLALQEDALFLPHCDYFFAQMVPELSSGHICSVQFSPFDAQLVACANSSGTVHLFNYDQYLMGKQVNSDLFDRSSIDKQRVHRRREVKTAQKHQLDTLKPHLSALRWKSAHELCCSFASQKAILVYDLNHSLEKPSQVLEGSSGDVFDFDLDKQTRQLIFSGCRNGALNMIDTREKGSTRSSAENPQQKNKSVHIPKLGRLGSSTAFQRNKSVLLKGSSYSAPVTTFGAIFSVQLSSCGQVGYAGTENGSVILFDVRHSGKHVHHLSLPQMINLFEVELADRTFTSRQTLEGNLAQSSAAHLNPSGSRVPMQSRSRQVFPNHDLTILSDADFSQSNSGAAFTVSSEWNKDYCSVQSIALNPKDEHMLAFQMGNGNVGYVDLLSRQVIKLCKISSNERKFCCLQIMKG